MAKKKQTPPVAKRDHIAMGFRPDTVPDGLDGSIGLLFFTAKYITWVFKMHAAVCKLGDSFYRCSFFNADGEWYKTTGSEELDDDISEFGWCELAEEQEPGDDDEGDDGKAAESVRSDCWTIEIGKDDVIFTLMEKHTDCTLQSQPLSLDVLRAMLERLK